MEGRARGSWGCSSDPPVPLPWLKEPGEDPGGASSRSGCRQLSFCRNWAHSEELPGLLLVIWWEAFPPRKREARNPIALSSPPPHQAPTSPHPQPLFWKLPWACLACAASGYFMATDPTSAFLPRPTVLGPGHPPPVVLSKVLLNDPIREMVLSRCPRL